MRGDFSERRRIVMRSQAKPALNQQHWRQGAWDQPQVIEPIMKKGDVTVRLNQPPIGGVERAAEEKERVEDVPERPHSKARITSPNPRPISSLNKKILERIMASVRQDRLFGHGRHKKKQAEPQEPKAPVDRHYHSRDQYRRHCQPKKKREKETHCGVHCRLGR